jgi:hypothetical protein
MMASLKRTHQFRTHYIGMIIVVLDDCNPDESHRRKIERLE